MRSLPNILKYFMKPHAEDYKLPDTEQMADTLEEMVRLKESVPYEGEPPSQSAEQDEATQRSDMEPEEVQESVPPVRSLSFARAEADALLRDAHTQADEIIAAAKQAGVYSEVSLEQRMGCGVGACVVCACTVIRDGEEKVLRVCKDGPVFLADEIEL